MDHDVIVVGGGNAALSAAVSARDNGAKRVLMLEKAPRYSTSEPFRSDMLEGLVKQLKVDHRQVMRTLEEYNRVAGNGGPFNSAVLDGQHTEGIDPPKTNWALRLDSPPYGSWPVTGGITFTFGGLFHYNYPLGTGLKSGAVFGRIAGRSAAKA